MAAIYKRMIENGKMTIEQVPPRWRDAVQTLLDAESSITEE